MLKDPASKPYQAPLLPGLSHDGRALVAATNAYCRDWYVAQKRSVLRFPRSQDDRRRARLMEANARRLLPSLEALTAPPALSEAFKQFVANEKVLLHAFGEEASANPAVVQQGVGAYEGRSMLRHGFAVRMGARGCDGDLPPAQWWAAARATHRFVLTTDPRQGCVSLVTAPFLIAEYQDTARPLAACRDDYRRERLGENSKPHNIELIGVSGVESLQATVTFAEIPCGCNFVAKLYFEHGRWLVWDVYPE